MKISFIVPVYKPNIGIFQKCLNSLQSQSYKDFEALVVLDGPDGEAEDVIHGMRDHRFKAIILEHGGVQKARNEGFKASKGEIVSFWDCDCLIEPDTCKTWIDTFADNPYVSFVYSGYKFLDEKGGIASEPFDPYTLKCGNYISTMFPLRREVFPGFDESLESLQDWDLWLTIVEKGGKGLFIPGYAFSTAYPTPESISGKGCTNEAWLGRVKAVKEKHNLPDRPVCVSSLGHRDEGIRLAKLINADYKDVPNYKPNNYTTVIQVGFSLHPNRVKAHSSIFNQSLKKKIIFWTAEDVSDIHNGLSLKSLHTYADYLNPHVIQFVEDLEAKKVMEAAGFKVSVLPLPMVNTDTIEPLGSKILIDTTEEYRQIITCLQFSLPEFTFDFLTENKNIKEYSVLLSLTPERTMPFTVKRALLSGRNIVSNIQSPFCGFVDDQQDPGKYIEKMVEQIRKRAGRSTSAAVNYWKQALNPNKLTEVLK